MEVPVNHTREGKGYSGEDNFVPWDNPDNIISFETFIAIESVIYCYINPIVFCIGVPANVLNCVVFFRQGLSLKNKFCCFTIMVIIMCQCYHRFLLSLFISWTEDEGSPRLFSRLISKVHDDDVVFNAQSTSAVISGRTLKQWDLMSSDVGLKY